MVGNKSELLQKRFLSNIIINMVELLNDLFSAVPYFKF